MLSVDVKTYAHAKVSFLYIYVNYHVNLLKFLILKIVELFLIYMQEHYTYKYHMAMVIVVIKLYCYQSEEELGQTIDHFWIEHETLRSSTGLFATSYIWKSSAIKYGKKYLWNNLYAKPFTKVLGLVGCRLTSKIIGIGPYERNWK